MFQSAPVEYKHSNSKKFTGRIGKRFFGAGQIYQVSLFIIVFKKTSISNQNRSYDFQAHAIWKGKLQIWVKRAIFLNDHLRNDSIRVSQVLFRTIVLKYRKSCFQTAGGNASRFVSHHWLELIKALCAELQEYYNKSNQKVSEDTLEINGAKYSSSRAWCSRIFLLSKILGLLIEDFRFGLSRRQSAIYSPCRRYVLVLQWWDFQFSGIHSRVVF